MGRDLHYALRQLRRSPGFALSAILTLALGIGATTAIFSVMNAVLLRSLPLPNPQRLVYLHVPMGAPDGTRGTGNFDTSFSEPVFAALRQEKGAFSEVMAFVPLSISKVDVRIGNSPEQAAGEMVSGNFFSGLGVPMARGRSLNMTDEKQNSSVAVISNAYWTCRFARDPSVLGQSVYIKGVPFTIVGISGERFPGVEAGQFTDFLDSHATSRRA